MPTADVLLAAPGGAAIRAAPPSLWLPRRRVLGWVRVGPFSLAGTFHLEPGGGDLGAALAHGRRSFLAVTEAAFHPVGAPHRALARPLVLVARAAVEAWAPLGRPGER